MQNDDSFCRISTLVDYGSLAALHTTGTCHPSKDNDNTNDVTIMVIQHTRYTMALRAYTAYRQTDIRERIFGKNCKLSGKDRKDEVNKLLFLSGARAHSTV